MIKSRMVLIVPVEIFAFSPLIISIYLLFDL